MGFTELLTVLFITLKLCNIITWSWVLVLLPEIIAGIIYIVIIVIWVKSFTSISRKIRD